MEVPGFRISEAWCDSLSIRFLLCKMQLMVNA